MPNPNDENPNQGSYEAIFGKQPGPDRNDGEDFGEDNTKEAQYELDSHDEPGADVGPDEYEAGDERAEEALYGGPTGLVKQEPQAPVFGLPMAIQHGLVALLGEMIQTLGKRAGPAVSWSAVIELPVYPGSTKIVMDIEEMLKRQAAFVYSQTGIVGQVAIAPSGIGYLGEPETDEYITLDRFTIGVQYPQQVSDGTTGE
jgi:hypothetical protein